MRTLSGHEDAIFALASTPDGRRLISASEDRTARVWDIESGRAEVIYRKHPYGVGHLAVRGPTGCRYLADARQKSYVCDGWNLTGDAYFQDEEGRFHFAARADDMIVSAGYNIAGPEVESALLSHADVGECAVIGVPDIERGQIVTAYVVLEAGVEGDAACVKRLQDHVKAVIAPYKYPRAVKFVDALPKTQTGKIQRFKLRQQGQS